MFTHVGQHLFYLLYEDTRSSSGRINLCARNSSSNNTSSSVFTSTNTEDNAASQDIDVSSHTAAKTVCKLSESEMSCFILERLFTIPL